MSRPTMQTDAAYVIDAEQAAFCQQGVSITLGGCDSGNVPSVARAFGCSVSQDRCLVTIYVSSVYAAPVLQAIKRNGAVAVVFSEPPTHKTIQLKGVDAFVHQVAQDAVRVVEQYREAFSRHILAIGFSPAFAESLLSCPASELVGISFSPSSAFTQSPGPNAGESLRHNA